MRQLYGLLALLLVIACRSHAGPLSPHDGVPVASLRDDRPVLPTPPRQPPPVSLTSTDGSGRVLISLGARAVVDDPLALTELRLQFASVREEESSFEILLPPGAQVTRFATRDGRGPWKEAEVVEKQYARRTYEALVAEQRDPALLERDTGNRFRARVYTTGAQRIVEVLVSYVEALPDPAAPYRLALRGLPQLGALDAQVMLLDRGGGPPTIVPYTLDGQAPAHDLVVPRPPPRAHGQRQGNRVVARVEPLHGVDPGELQPLRRLTVLVDTSASRAFEHDATVEALEALLHGLSRHVATAHLEVLAFDQQVVPIYEGPLASVDAGALAGLRARRSLGASDLHGALEALRDQGVRDRVLLVTDGLVSAGDASDAGLRRVLGGLAQRGVDRLDVLQVGAIHDDARLRALVTGPMPRSGVRLDPSHDPDRLARRLLLPTFDGLRLDVPGATWWYPREVDGLQPGDHLLVHAELPEGRDPIVQVSGPVFTEHALELHEVDSPLLEHVWMHGRVENLVERIAELEDRLESETLRNLAVSLSVRHRIFNDFTAFLVLDTEEDYERFGLDRRALSDVLVVGPAGVTRQPRGPDDDADSYDYDYAEPDEAEPEPPLADAPMLARRRRGSMRREKRAREIETGAGPMEKAAVGETIAMEEFRNVPVGRATGRDFTQVVESSATASRDSEGISLAGTSGSEAIYVTEGADIDRPVFRSIPIIGTLGAISLSRGPEPARVRIHGVEVDGSGLSRRDARSTVKGQRGALEACYFDALVHEHAHMRGRVRVELRLDERGTPISALAVRQRGLDDDDLLRCIDRALRDTLFAVRAGHAPEVGFTLVFQRRDGPPAHAYAAADPPRRSPAEGPALLRDVEATLAAGRPREAWVRAWRWREADPASVLALLALGEVAEATGDLPLAARAHGSLLDLFPSRADMLRHAAGRLETLGPDALALAIDAYRRALAERPDHPTSYRTLAYALVRDDRPEEAFDVLEEALDQSYPSGRFEAAQRVLREDLGLVAAAWEAQRPVDALRIEGRLARRGVERPTGPSLRFVLSWESDGNDVDLHVQDAEGNDAYHRQPTLPGGGELFADVADGYGPECFAVQGPAAQQPYRIRVHYYDRGPMGYGMGKVQAILHDGEGGLTIEDRSFVITESGGIADLGVFSLGTDEVAEPRSGALPHRLVHATR